MAKKRYLYVGVSVFLALLIPTPVFSDAPSHLMRQQLRNYDSEENSTEEIGGKPQVSSKKKPNQVQGSNDPSSTKNGVRGGGIGGRGSKPAGITSVPEQRENPGTNNSSSGVLSNGATQNPTNKPSGGSSQTGQTSQPLPIVGGSNTSGVLSNGATQNPTNKPSGESSQTGQTSQPSSLVGGSNTSGVLSNGATQNPTNKPSVNPSGIGQTSQPSSLVGGSNTSPSGRKIDSGVDSSILNSLLKNPFAWLLLLLLLGLLALLLWWLGKRRQRQINQYVDQIFEQKIKNNIGFIINNFVNQDEFKHYIDQYLVRQIDSSFEQKIKNNIPLITHNIANDNQELNHYIDQRLQHSVINNTRINYQIVNFVANSSEINNKINKVYRDIDIKIENIRNEWNQAFLILVGQYVDELINIIGGRETFNILIANLISVKLDELLNQIIRTKNELTVIMNNADTHLYEWTLGELIAIKGCLTDREVLAEQLVSFSAELKTKLDCTPCVDINKFERFKPISIDYKQQPQQLPGS